MPGGRQRRERVGYLIGEARDAEGKRRSQIRENRIFEVIPEAKMTLNELSTWYLALKSVQKLRSFDRIKGALGQVNAVMGDRIVGSIKPIDLEEYQNKRIEDRKAPATVDMDISIVKTMVFKAFENDMIGGNTIKAFKKVKKLLKRNSNVRDRVLTRAEYKKLMSLLPHHTRAIIAIAVHTGMRRGEILSLTWDKVDLKKRMIKLEATDTKDKEPRKIAISKELYLILNGIPKAIHDNHVILYNGKPIKDIRGALVRACKHAGIHYGRFKKGAFIFHDTRHTFNTNMRKAGVNQSVTMKMTGHSTSDMYERYNTVDEDDIRGAVDQMERFLENVDQNVDQASNLRSSENKKG
jgi:integrase